MPRTPATAWAGCRLTTVPTSRTRPPSCLPPPTPPSPRRRPPSTRSSRPRPPVRSARRRRRHPTLLPPATTGAAATVTVADVIMAIEYRIDELAREAGTTVRNVRAYQDRGLLPPPRRSGRVGLYTDAHLARLRLIGQLLERGYSLGNIAELISAWERGQDIGELLGLEAALVEPWSDEVAITISLVDLNELFGDDQDALQEAVKLGLLEPEEAGESFRVPSPRLLHAGAELIAAGIPLDA